MSASLASLASSVSSTKKPRSSNTTNNNERELEYQEMSTKRPLLSQQDDDSVNNNNDNGDDHINDDQHHQHHGSSNHPEKKKSKRSGGRSPSVFTPTTSPQETALEPHEKSSRKKKSPQNSAAYAAITSTTSTTSSPSHHAKSAKSVGSFESKRQMDERHPSSTFGSLEVPISPHGADADLSTGVNINALVLNRKYFNQHELTSDHPVFSETARILLKEQRAKVFRVNLRFALALSAVLNFILVIVYFFLVPPPDMAENAWISYANEVDKSSTVAEEWDPRKRWDLFPSVSNTTVAAVYVSEGLLQLGFLVVAQTIFLLQYLSRNPNAWQWLGDRIPRTVARPTGFTRAEFGEAVVWAIHCPIYFAEISTRFRYLNGVVVLRLYVVLLAGMQMTDFGNPMMRVMSNFFGLRLNSGVFLRWALEFHKWKVLIPTFLFLWVILALCFAFAEGLSWETSMWFIMTTMTTVGYGDVYPLRPSGRVVAIVGMCVGLVVLAYIVAQVQSLTTRPPHEQKVLDALRISKLQGEAKMHASRVLMLRYRLKNQRVAGSPMTSLQKSQMEADLQRQSQNLQETMQEIRLLPPVFDAQNEALMEIRDNVREVMERLRGQQQQINELKTIVTQQQTLIALLSQQK